MNARAAMALGACAFLAACNPQPENPSSATPTPESTVNVPLSITQQGSPKHPIVITQQKGNRLEYRLTALRSVGTASQGAGSGTFYTTTVTFYQASGATLTATSPRALIDQGDSKQTVRMVDGVTAVTSDGHTFRCRELAYGDGDKTLHGDGDVVITGPHGMRLTGNHFDSDVDLTNVRMR